MLAVPRHVHEGELVRVLQEQLHHRVRGEELGRAAALHPGGTEGNPTKPLRDAESGDPLRGRKGGDRRVAGTV